MSIVSGVIDWLEKDPKVLEYLINVNRPYNKELRRLKNLINFGVISNYMAVKCSDEFKNKEHSEALKINKEMN